MTKITDPAGNVTTIQLDATGNPVTSTNPLSGQWVRTFAPQGLGGKEKVSGTFSLIFDQSYPAC